MRWRHPLIYGALLLAWLAFAAWQYRSYRHEQQLAQEILHRQSHSVMNALVGGVRSHRRLGRFFQDQLQGMLVNRVVGKRRGTGVVGQKAILQRSPKSQPSRKILSGNTCRGPQIVHAQFGIAVGIGRRSLERVRCTDG